MDRSHVQELLEKVVDGTRDASVLVLITLRPEGLPISFGQANVTLTMSRLGDRQTATLIAGVSGGPTCPPNWSSKSSPRLTAFRCSSRS